MSNKGLLTFTLVLILVSLVATILEFSIDDPVFITQLAEGSYLLATLCGAYLLFVNSDIKSTIWWRVINFAIGVLILGVLFKILHLVGADEILFAGCAGIVTSYLLRFINKPTKNHLDILKLLTVLSFSVTYLLVIFHYVSSEYNVITKALFWTTIFDFAYLEWRNGVAPTQKK